MTFQQLKYIIEISKSRSITAAAQNLFISQPSLSKSVKELETELGITILERTRHGISFTSSGNLIKVINAVEAPHAAAFSNIFGICRSLRPAITGAKPTPTEIPASESSFMARNLTLGRGAPGSIFLDISSSENAILK